MKFCAYDNGPGALTPDPSIPSIAPTSQEGSNLMPATVTQLHRRPHVRHANRNLAAVTEQLAALGHPQTHDQAVTAAAVILSDFPPAELRACSGTWPALGELAAAIDRQAAAS